MKTKEIVSVCDRCYERKPLIGTRMGMICQDCLSDAQIEQDEEDENDFALSPGD